jgi:HAD superfamily hydrolase (TIGR01509 family)
VNEHTLRADDRGGDVVPLEAVLLDVDGTLIDSNDAHAQAWSDTLREAGYEIGSEAVRPLIGMGSDKLLPTLIGIDAESEDGKRLVERRKEIFAKEYLPAIRPFPNATQLLDRLRQDGLKLVVATSASDEELKGLLEALGDKSLLEDATSSSDADRSKPDPDIIHAAVSKSGATAAECVMLGDTPYDVEAARKGGVSIIALRCGGWGDDALVGAAEIYDDPKDLLAKYGESLIGRRVAAIELDVTRRAGRERQRPQEGEESHANH